MTTSNKRPGKGSSIIAFPDDYVAVDLETTGLSLYCDKVIEVGAVRIEGGRQTEMFQELVNPGFPINGFIERLTGITNAMLDGARDEAAVLPDFLAFLREGDVLVGHNIVAFDANFLYDASVRVGRDFPYDLVDVMRIGRKLHPEWEHHCLDDFRDFYGITGSGAHRALRDALDASAALECCRADLVASGTGVDAFCQVAKRGTRKPPRLTAILPTALEFDEGHPFYGKEVAITGALGYGWTRAMGQQAIVNCGGVPVDRFKKRSTNYLVVADYSRCTQLGGEPSAQHRNALAAKKEGRDVEIIDPETFFDLVGAEFAMA